MASILSLLKKRPLENAPIKLAKVPKYNIIYYYRNRYSINKVLSIAQQLEEYSYVISQFGFATDDNSENVEKNYLIREFKRLIYESIERCEDIINEPKKYDLNTQLILLLKELLIFNGISFETDECYELKAGCTIISCCDKHLKKSYYSSKKIDILFDRIAAHYVTFVDF